MSAVMWFILLFLSILTTVSIVYYSFCIFASGRFRFQKEKQEPEVRSQEQGVRREGPGVGNQESTGGSQKSAANLDPVSILIPLCGADFKAIENYATFCRQDYPSFQIVFGVMDPNDSSVPVVENLKRLFPEIDIELVVGSRIIGHNPKVNNLFNMLDRAKHEVLVLVDSDIRVGGDYLAKVIPPLLDERTGMVTCLYRAGEAPNVVSVLEAIGITADFAPSVMVAAATEGVSFAFGATIALSRKQLDAIGGFPAIADYLADDFMLGQLVHKAGYEIQIADTIVETILPRMTLFGMLKHQLRWARGIRACRPWGHFGAVVTHGTSLALLGFILSGGAPLNTGLLLVSLIFRFAVAWRVGVQTLGDNVLRKNLLMLPLRDLLGFVVWLFSLAGKKVEWRGKKYRIVEDGKMSPI